MTKLKRKLKNKFTKWYVRNGYTFDYDENLCAVWHCPWYVKPFLFLFSPSIYDVECITQHIIDGFYSGLQADITNAINNITKGGNNDH